jgi:hypothetical protein
MDIEKIKKQLKQVLILRLVNIFDINAIQNLANEMGLCDLVIAIEDDEIEVINQLFNMIKNQE